MSGFLDCLKVDGFAELTTEVGHEGYQVQTAKDAKDGLDPFTFSSREPHLLAGGNAGLGVQCRLPLDDPDFNERIGIGVYGAGGIGYGQYRMTNPFSGPNLIYDDQALNNQATLDAVEYGVGGRVSAAYYFGDDRNIPVGLVFDFKKLWTDFGSPGDRLQVADSDSDLYSFAEDGDGGWASSNVWALAPKLKLGPVTVGPKFRVSGTSDAMTRNITESEKEYLPAGWDGANFRVGGHTPGRVNQIGDMTVEIGLDVIELGMMLFGGTDQKQPDDPESDLD